MNFSTFPNTNELFLRPSKIYPTLLQGVIPSPYSESFEQRLFDLIKTIEYDTKGINSRSVLDRCIMYNIIYKCEYSQTTMKIINKVIDEVYFLLK